MISNQRFIAWNKYQDALKLLEFHKQMSIRYPKYQVMVEYYTEQADKLYQDWDSCFDNQETLGAFYCPKCKNSWSFYTVDEAVILSEVHQDFCPA